MQDRRKFVFIFTVYLTMYTSIHICMYACLWRPEANFRIPLTGVGLADLTRLTAIRLQRLSHVYFPVTGVTSTHHHACLFKLGI